MMKLPINPVLYLAALGLTGASALQFWDIVKLRKARPDQAKVREDFDGLITRGQAAKADKGGNEYAGPDRRAHPWWKNFQEANFIGKLPPPPPDPIDPGAAAAKDPSALRTPIGDILELEMLVYDAGKPADSKIVVRYKPEANVQVPESQRPSAGAYGGPGDLASGSDTSTMPSSGIGGDAPRQQMKIGDELWPPFEHITLVGIDVSTSLPGGLFKREADGDGDKAEKLYADEMELGQELLAEIEKATGRKTANQPKKGVKPKVEDNAWIDVAQTQLRDGAIHISRDDNQFLQNEGRKLFAEELGVQQFRSSRSKRRGLQITRVPRKLQRFGAQVGDVVLAVNGVAVHSKARAVKVGKDLYRKGVRTFHVTVMRRGLEQVITYRAPEK